ELGPAVLRPASTGPLLPRGTRSSPDVQRSVPPLQHPGPLAWIAHGPHKPEAQAKVWRRLPSLALQACVRHSVANSQTGAQSWLERFTDAWAASPQTGLATRPDESWPDCQSGLR